ncbi:MAG: orotidine-5'-phosphate decarboxylase [Lentisphaerae bacterium]|nr:orotidine-5'-phosphate decarboxylase [Lentisphaerota bacterium]
MNRSELIVALDVADSSAIGGIVDRLPDEVRWYKVGLELFAAEGPKALEPLAARGRHVFLDLKLHDIPRTVERAVRAAARHGVGLLTLHASGGRAMIEAAAEAARGAGPAAPKILAVTVLTSLDAADLAAIGVGRAPADQVLALAEVALSAGADGVVCSPQEAAAMRKRFGAGPLLVTPGIRLPSDAVGDQKRVATPAGAVRDGATHLVVGRPILEAADPAAAARRVLADMAAGEAG